MTARSLSESEFIKLTSEWLNPEIPTILLCRNVVDIMRFRIFFHEKFYPAKKSIFNAQFMTIDQWIKKVLPSHPESEKILHSKLAEKALILKQLEAYNQENLFLNNLLQMPGFKNEILYLWYLYTWNRQFQPDFLHEKKEESLSSELFSLFQTVYDNILKSNSFPLPQVYTSRVQKQISGFHTTGQVICLFAADYNIIEKIKLTYLICNHPCLWRFVFNDTLEVNRENPVLQISDTIPDSYEIYRLKSDQNRAIPFAQWLSLNRSFFSEKPKYRESKIWMCKGAHDEFHLLARSIRTLYDRGIALHRIFLLYANARELPLLEYYLKKCGLGLNYPEKYSAATRSIVSISIELIDLLSLRKDKISLTRNQFIDLLLNPLFSIEKKLSQNLVDFLYENYSLLSEISISDLSKELLHSPNLLPIYEFVQSLVHDKDALCAKKLPSQHSRDYWNTLLKYFQNQTGDNFLKSQFTHIEKIILGSASLDRYFPDGLEPDFYYQLIQDELKDLKLPSSYVDTPDRNLPEIYARNIQEGIHSPVDYLFISNLTSRTFPSPNKHPDFLDIREEGQRFTLNLSAEEQMKKMETCLNMADKGVCLTFHLQNDPAPSEFVFQQIPVNEGEILKKEHLLDELPFYQRPDENTPIIEAIKDLNRYPEIPHEVQYNDEAAMQQSFMAKFIPPNPGTTNEIYKPFTGLVQPEDIKKVSSSGSVESLAWCPQMFYFDKIQKLSSPINYFDVRILEKRHTGTLFHSSAKFLIDYLIENFPKVEYNQIMGVLGESKLDHLLHESFKKAEKSLLEENKTDFEIFTGIVLHNAYGQYSQYFKKFFYLAQKNEHPFYNYYPLAVELSFENVPIGPFQFRGRMDRIDYCPDQELLCVLDYKTGNSTGASWSREDIKSLSKFQLPLYVKAIHDLLKSTPGMWNERVTQIQGAYEFTAITRKPSTISFMEIDEGKNTYDLETIAGDIESLTENNLHLLRRILENGYFFAFGHKKNPDSEWETTCNYCNFAMICDRAPYGTMMARMQNNKTSNNFLKELYQGKSTKGEESPDSES